MPETISLTEIQKLQFSDRHRAEKEFLSFLQNYEDPTIKSVELTPKPESLNSVNGFITYESGERYFFKSHTEENEKISEYYNDTVLAKYGYPVLSTKQISHKPGKQIALYEIISLPTLFDLVKEEEDKLIVGRNVSQNARDLIAGQPLSPNAKELIASQKDLDIQVADIYEKTLRFATIEENANAAINQLFINRLQESGRIGLFYRDKSLLLGDNLFSFEKLSKMHWIINGVEYKETIEQLIKNCREILAPQPGPVIVGHGDAHNGNIFVERNTNKFYMFDPAFAGWHNPFLDITKPIIHNVFFRWMYFPQQVSSEIDLTYKIDAETIYIDHNVLPSTLRKEFLLSKINNVLRPTVYILEAKNMLIENWQNYLRAAFFCCPFLTVNLLANEKANGTLAETYTLPIKLLGLAMSIELGGLTKKGNSALADMIGSIFNCLEER